MLYEKIDPENENTHKNKVNKLVTFFHVIYLKILIILVY